MIQKYIKVFLSFAFILIIGGCSKTDTPPISDSAEVANMTGYDGYENTKEVFMKDTNTELITALKEKKDGIYYIGYEDCPWCIEAVPLMGEAAEKLNKKIMYLDIKNETLTTADTDAVKLALDEILDVDEEGVKTLYVPEVVVMKDGKIKAHHNATVEGHNANERKMTSDEQKALLDIYSGIFK